MTFGSVKKSVAEWDDLLDNLFFPKLFENIVSELEAAGYHPENVKERLSVCQQSYDRIRAY
jgi:hypothetical protein